MRFRNLESPDYESGIGPAPRQRRFPENWRHHRRHSNLKAAPSAPSPVASCRFVVARAQHGRGRIFTATSRLAARLAPLQRPARQELNRMRSARIGLLVVFSVGPLCAATDSVKPVVECGATLTRSAKLDADLVCGASALTIATPGVALNCSGHTIRGTVPGGIAVRVTAANVSVTDCTIEGFSSGINASDASGLKVARNRCGQVVPARAPRQSGRVGPWVYLDSRLPRGCGRTKWVSPVGGSRGQRRPRAKSARADHGKSIDAGRSHRGLA